MHCTDSALFYDHRNNIKERSGNFLNLILKKPSTEYRDEEQNEAGKKVNKQVNSNSSI
jgi:hypothetical protein